MNPKKSSFVLLLAVFGQILLVSSQSSIFCDYYEASSIYTCNMTIINPDGLDNFTTIEGDHLAGRHDFDVRRIRITNSTVTLNIPSIMCEKLRFTHSFYASNTQIMEIGPNSFRGCAFISIIQMWNSKITFLANNAFSNNRFLTRLDLSTNYIMELPDNIFAPLVNLRELILYGNYIQVIQSSVFSSHPSLTDIQINSNFIHAISPAILDRTRLTSLYASTNICIDTSVYDVTANRTSLRSALARCFNNYELLDITTPLPTPPPGSCGEGNIFDRVCQLEEEVAELRAILNGTVV